MIYFTALSEVDFAKRSVSDRACESGIIFDGAIIQPVMCPECRDYLVISDGDLPAQCPTCGVLARLSFFDNLGVLRKKVVVTFEATEISVGDG